MKKRLYIPFWVRTVAVVLILTLALGYMVAERIKILTTGAEIVLKTKPVDPRDFFRGHYARLKFDISDIPGVLSEKDKRPKKNDTIFVSLKAGQDGYWYMDSVHQKFPPHQPGIVVIKGRVKNSYSRVLRVQYGIERYFAPKAEALKLEDLNAKKANVGIILRISSKGEAAISGLMINGKKIYEEPLF